MAKRLKDLTLEENMLADKAMFSDLVTQFNSCVNGLVEADAKKDNKKAFIYLGACEALWNVLQPAYFRGLGEQATREMKTKLQVWVENYRAKGYSQINLPLTEGEQFNVAHEVEDLSRTIP